MARKHTTGAPHFVGVGTQRSGTTWWFETLLGHPQIRSARGGKELHFFDRFCVEPMTDADVAAYHERFRQVPGKVTGEWTPRYMRDFWTPPLLARAAPEAKLIVMFRDPVERFRSGVPHRIAQMPGIRAESAVSDAIERGRYASQLKRVLAHFDAARILVLQYEKCVADPAGQYRRSLRFLGVDPDHSAAGFDALRGTTQATNKPPLWDDLQAGLRAALEPEVAELAALCPEIDLSLWKHFSHLTAADALPA